MTPRKCNCRNKGLCPIDGECLTSYVICEDTVTTTSGLTNTHIGWWKTISKQQSRYNNHKLSFNDGKHSHATVPSKHIWELKNINISYNLKWRIIKLQFMLIRETLHFIHPYRLPAKHEIWTNHKMLPWNEVFSLPSQKAPFQPSLI